MTVLSPVIFHTLVAAAAFEPLPELAPRHRAPAERAVRQKPDEPRETIDLSRMRTAADGRFVVTTNRGRDVALTLEPAWQLATEKLLADTDPVLGGVVVMRPDGTVLALAGRSAAGGDRPDLATDPWAPSASVFKVVTAAALLDAGVTADTQVCVHGGGAALAAENLEDDARKDKLCASLAAALAYSNNAIVGKLALRHLQPAGLAETAALFGYDQPVDFGHASFTDIPAAPPLEVARAAAGFWHTQLSPVGGAVVAATVASGGFAVVPRLVASPAGHKQALTPATARTLTAMMVGTTTFGTARSAFHDASGRPYLRVPVAGKTGTLSRRPVAGLEPLDYSWFVGFAPADKPEVVVSVLLASDPRHRLRAATLAREVLAQRFNRALSPGR